MADFENLLGDLDEQPSPSTSLHDPAETYNATTQGTNNANQQDEAEDETNAIPAVLQQALVLQENPVLDNETGEGERDGIEDDEQPHTNADYETLKRLWIQELNSTELCQYNNEFMEEFLEHLSMQEDVIENLREQGRSGADPTLASIASSICKMDMDRLSFTLADLMRIRLEKIEKYALHNRDPLILERMSQDEIGYLQQYGTLFQGHMQRSVTDHLPKEAWKKLDDPEMIDRPNLDTYVFCKVVDDEGVIIDNHLGLDISAEEEEDGAVREQEFDKDSHIFVRYRVVRDLVSEGKVELLM